MTRIDLGGHLAAQGSGQYGVGPHSRRRAYEQDQLQEVEARASLQVLDFAGNLVKEIDLSQALPANGGHLLGRYERGELAPQPE